jgi:hypothetical protein
MKPTDPARLWRAQLALECKAFSRQDRLIEFPCDDPDGLATCYLVTYVDGGTELVFAQDAPDWFVDRARRINADQYLSHVDYVARQIGADHGSVTVLRCRTYCFPRSASPIAGPAALLRNGPERIAAAVDGRQVAEATSSRSNDAAAELWVHTDPEFRRRGYAAQVASAWGASVTAEGKVAFYSHLHHNAASRSLAGHLGVVPLFDLIGLTLDQSHERK